MIYSTQKRKHRKTGKHNRNMRGGNEESFFDTGTLTGIGIGIVIIAILLSLAFTGVLHAKNSSSSGKSF